MPGFIKTPKDEKLWQEAKEIVEDEKDVSEKGLTDKDLWPLVTHIWKQKKKKRGGSNIMKFKLNEDVKIGSKVIKSGNIIEVIVPLGLQGQRGSTPMRGLGQGGGYRGRHRRLDTSGLDGEVIVPLGLQGQCGGDPLMDGSGGGLGNIGTDKQPDSFDLSDIIVPLGLQGQCGGDPLMDGSGGGLGNIGTDKQPQYPIVIEDKDRVASTRNKTAKLSKFKIEFHTGNSAFVDNYEGEIESILKSIIKLVKKGYSDGTLQDSNGNNVGAWKS